tara:strand:+ start:1126 stop:1428 length:303 start_codon:yes stop_codon:yes gene_type:complete
MGNMTAKEWKEWLENTTDKQINDSISRIAKMEFDQENPELSTSSGTKKISDNDMALLKAEKQRRIRSKNKANPMGKKNGGTIKKFASGGAAKRGYGKARR